MCDSSVMLSVVSLKWSYWLDVDQNWGRRETGLRPARHWGKKLTGDLYLGLRPEVRPPWPWRNGRVGLLLLLKTGLKVKDISADAWKCRLFWLLFHWMVCLTVVFWSPYAADWINSCINWLNYSVQFGCFHRAEITKLRYDREWIARNLIMRFSTAIILLNAILSFPLWQFSINCQFPSLYEIWRLLMGLWFPYFMLGMEKWFNRISG